MTDRALAGHLFESIRALSAARAGVSRQSYGEVETATLEVIAAAAREAGLDTAVDAAANLVVSRPREDGARALWIGSHVDSVPEGGNYDGLAGVVAGLLCLIRAHREDARTEHPLRLLALRGEESAWFGKPYLGSSALLGLLTQADLERRRRGNGRTLGEYMAEARADVRRIAAGERLIDPSRIAGWLELHIEQGPVMVQRDVAVGIVTGIRGNYRNLAARCIGVPGHSGAVPRAMRHDAVLALAHLLSRIDGHWQAMELAGADLVFTSGMIGTNPEEHSGSRIPGEVSFSLEMRSQSIETLDSFHGFVLEQCAAIGAERGVRFDLGERVFTHPAALDAGWMARLRAAAVSLGYPCIDIASGAGHDAAVFSQAGIPAAMLFVRNQNGSHNPEEAMELDDFMAATEVLYRAVTHLDPVT